MAIVEHHSHMSDPWFVGHPEHFSEQNIADVAELTDALDRLDTQPPYALVHCWDRAKKEYAPGSQIQHRIGARRKITFRNLAENEITKIAITIHAINFRSPLYYLCDEDRRKCPMDTEIAIEVKADHACQVYLSPRGKQVPYVDHVLTIGTISAQGNRTCCTYQFQTATAGFEYLPYNTGRLPDYDGETAINMITGAIEVI